MDTQTEYYTIFGPSLDYPVKLKTMGAVLQWFYFYGPFEITPDVDDPETWDFAGGWFIELNDGSHMEPEEWENLATYPELEP